MSKINLVANEELYKLAGIKIAFFSVGQGNMTIIISPNNNSIWIIDAGSTQLPFNAIAPSTLMSDINSNSVIEGATFWIQQYVDIEKNFEKITINVVISHSDRDHTIYISSLLASILGRKRLNESKYIIKIKMPPVRKTEGKIEIKKEGKKIKNGNIYITGSLSDKKNDPAYTDAIALADYYMDQFSNVLIEVPPGNKENIISNNVGDISDIKIYAPYITSNDQNSKSLIVKITYKDVSLLVPGDATQKTYDSIGVDKLTADILLASHHGSATHQSNDLAIYNKINPSAIIFSAPQNSSHEHPSSFVLHTAAKYFSHKHNLNNNILAPDHYIHSNLLPMNIMERWSDQYMVTSRNKTSSEIGFYAISLAYRPNVKKIFNIFNNRDDWVKNLHDLENAQIYANQLTKDVFNEWRTGISEGKAGKPRKSSRNEKGIERYLTLLEEYYNYTTAEELNKVVNAKDYNDHIGIITKIKAAIQLGWKADFIRQYFHYHFGYADEELTIKATKKLEKSINSSRKEEEEEEKAKREEEKEEEDFKRKNSRLFSLYTTNYPIFTTSSQGTIILSWGEGGMTGTDTTISTADYTEIDEKIQLKSTTNSTIKEYINNDKINFNFHLEDRVILTFDKEGASFPIADFLSLIRSFKDFLHVYNNFIESFKKKELLTGEDPLVKRSAENYNKLINIYLDTKELRNMEEFSPPEEERERISRFLEGGIQKRIQRSNSPKIRNLD